MSPESEGILWRNNQAQVLKLHHHHLTLGVMLWVMQNCRWLMMLSMVW